MRSRRPPARRGTSRRSSFASDSPAVAGNVVGIGDRGARELHFPDQLDGTERVLLVPAPLPTPWIESVTFQSVADKRACEADAKDFGNVPLEDFKRTSSKVLFTKAPETPWPPGEGPAERVVPLERPLAAGGVMAMLLLFGNLGDSSVGACRSAFDPAGGEPGPAHDHPILAGLEFWIREGTAPLPPPVDADSDRIALQRRFQARLFWEAVECLVKWREGGRPGSTEDVCWTIWHKRRRSSIRDCRRARGSSATPSNP